MKVLVIGGAGYIGSNAVLELLNKNHEVVVLDNLSTGIRSFVPDNVTFYEKDITVKDDLDYVFAIEKDIDVVMHFAAKLVAPESLEQPLDYYHNNVEGVRLMLEAMVQHNIKNLIFSSTAAVYGLEGNNAPCTEETPTIPINPYGETKLACEKMIYWAANAHDINYCIFRYFNVAGADQSGKIGVIKEDLTLVPIVIQTALKQREKVVIYGTDYPTKDGTCIRDLIHVSDLARAHVLGADYLINNKLCQVINLGSGSGYTVKEVIDEVNKLLPVNYENGNRREGDPIISVADVSKAKTLLNWEPSYKLNEIIKSDLEFRKSLWFIDKNPYLC